MATFDVPDVEGALRDLALPAGTPLSVVAVKLPPGNGLVQRDVMVGDVATYMRYDRPDRPADPAVPGSDRLGSDVGTMASKPILLLAPYPVEPACQRSSSNPAQNRRKPFGAWSGPDRREVRWLIDERSSPGPRSRR